MYQINSYAKVNLSLDVLSKRDDGYHNIDTIMQLIDLKDIITIEPLKEDILIIETDNKDIPTDENNLIYKMWEELKLYRNKNNGLRVKVEKNIPVAAGLAGGSSNAAYFVKLVDKIWNLKLSRDTMHMIGKKHGADIPYFFEEGTIRATGIGCDFQNLPSFNNIDILIVNNGCKVSTEYVYKNINLTGKSNIDRCVEAISSRDPFNREYYYNTMTEISGQICPDIHNIIEELYENNAKVALMSGSGSTVFALYDREDEIEKSYEKLKEKYEFVCRTKTL